MNKEFNILNYFNTRALFMGIGLSRIISISKEYTIISIILGSILGLILLNLFKISIKRNKLNIILNSIIIIISLIILSNMISTMYLTNMPSYLILLPFILLILYLINKKEIIIYRLANILLVINLLLYTISIISLMKYFNINNFYYTNTTIKDIIISSIYYTLFSITPVLLTIKDNNRNYNLSKMYIISTITLSFIFIITYGILGSALSSIVRYPEYLVLRIIRLSESFENIQNIISYMWIIDIFMLIASSTNNIKYNLKNKKNINYILIFLSILTIIIYNYYEFIILIYKITPIILLIILVLNYIINKFNHIYNQ